MNELNKDQAAILQILQEECAEVIQATSKVFRFGLFDTHPDTPSKTNTRHLEEELGDVLAMIELLDAHQVISYNNIIQLKQRKFDKLRTWSKINVDFRR